MNELTKVTVAPPVQMTSVSASASSKISNQKNGNPLPPAAQTATSKPLVPADQEAVAEQVRVAVAQMNEYIQSTQRDLHFSYDATSGETVVKVLDRSTQEVIRQIPDEIFLRLAQQLDTNEQINFLNAQA